MSEEQERLSAGVVGASGAEGSSGEELWAGKEKRGRRQRVTSPPTMTPGNFKVNIQQTSPQAQPQPQQKLDFGSGGGRKMSTRQLLNFEVSGGVGDSSNIRRHHHHHHHHQQHHHQTNNRHRHHQRRSSPCSVSSLSSTRHSHSQQHYKQDAEYNRQRPHERYVQSNYRFLTRPANMAAPTPIHTSPPPPAPSSTLNVDWEEVEQVIIPVPEDPRCPICLDGPELTAPRVTQCGHYFCWTCLLRYQMVTTPDTTSAAAGVSRNWRTCPICFEQFHQKKVKPVAFYPIASVAVNTRHEFALLRRELEDGGGSVKCLDRTLATIDPSPFAKVTRVGWGVVREVALGERRALLTRLAALQLSDQDDGERHFIQQALEAVKERLDQIELVINQPSQSPSDHPIEASLKDSTVYFHQSSDGQYVFLHPLTIKMLKTHFASYNRLPASIVAPVRELEDVVFGSEERKRYKYLAGYVPPGATITFCELDLQGIVGDAVLAQFGREIAIRSEARRERAVREDYESRSAARRSSLEEGFLYGNEDDDDDTDLKHSTSYSEDFVNFPMPPGSSSTADASVGMPEAKPAVWYNNGGYAAAHSLPTNGPSLLFNLSLEDLQAATTSPPTSPTSTGKKGKKFVLLGGTRQHRG